MAFTERDYVKTRRATILYGTLAFGSVLSASYTTIITAADNYRILSVENTTDKIIYLSFDGGTTNHLVIQATTGTKLIELGQVGLHLDQNIAVKAVTANATSGAVYVTVFG